MKARSRRGRAPGDRREVDLTAEWAIAATTAEIAAVETAGDMVPTRKGWRAHLSDGRPVIFSRFYVGDEFCEHLIPSPSEWKDSLRLSERRGVPVTLVAPPCTDDGLDRLRPLLKALVGRAGSEVLVSDWGALRLIRAEFPKLVPVLGRCLRRQLKDPRVADLPAAGSLSPSYVGLLKKMGVGLLSADRLPDEESPLPLAVHLPYTFITSGRLCVVSGVQFTEREKFRPDFTCNKPCRHFLVELHSPQYKTPILQKGNTLHYLNGGVHLISKAVAVKRWVFDLSLDRSHSMLRAAGSTIP